MEDDDHLLLEVTLISAQGLKSPFTSNLRRLQAYAVTYIHPSVKLRTRTDSLSSENPTWNDKFLFRVSPSFLSSDTSAITVDVFASGILKDPFLGSVRILLSTFSSFPPHLRFRSPSFAAFQIRRPSGRFQGVLNIAAMVVDGSDLGSLHGTGMSAIGHRDLLGKKGRRRHHQRSGRKLESGEESGFSGGDSTEVSDADGGESTTSTSNSSAASTMSTSMAPSPRILREMNGEELGRKEGGMIRCWLGKMHISPSDENIRALCSSEQTKRL